MLTSHQLQAELQSELQPEPKPMSAQHGTAQLP
jgi:hypothetical protein